MTRCQTLFVLVAVLLLAGHAFADADAADVSGDWLQAIQKQIADSEYELSWQDRPQVELGSASGPGAWHAPNREHGFRTYFTQNGIRLIPRVSGDGPSWEFGLSLSGYGRGRAVAPVSAPSLAPDENRIDYERGDIVEWYVNDRRGLEQGFTLAEPPRTSEAVAMIAHRTVDRSTARVGGREPGLRRPAGFEHGATHNGAADDAGANEPAFLALELHGTLSPRIAADGQAIDFVTPAGAFALRYDKLHVYDALGRDLPAWMEGFAEAGRRGIRLVFDDSQAVYPVTVDPLATNHSWITEGNQVGAEFGYAVSTAGDVNGDGYSDVIVGARRYDNGQADEGRAYVYHGTPSGVFVVASWFAESDQAGAQFGYSVSTAGDVDRDGYTDVIVGARLYSNGEVGEGRAYVYHGSATGLSSAPAWTAESDQPFADFGAAVSTAGDVNWDGYSDVIVGANLYDSGETNEGRAYVYHGSPSGLSSTPSWTAESNQAGAQMGLSVSTAGDVNGDRYADVIVGAHLYDNGETDEGRAYVYHGSPSGLSSAAAWTTESDQTGASFGSSVSAAGDVNGDGYADVIVGAHLYDNFQSNEGRAYLYVGSSGGLSSATFRILESNQTGAYFGWSVSTAGDVNGDGYADVIIGAYNYDSGEPNEGRAYVYHGSRYPPSASPSWTMESDQSNASFGYAVSAAGDVNGDGYADVIVGTHLFDSGQTNEGRAYVYHGAAGGLSSVPGSTKESNQVGAWFGQDVSTAGDINGDGYADVIVGAPLYDNGETAEGRAFVYYGSASGLAHTAAWTAEGNQEGAQFGSHVSTAGDIDGNGLDDVIIGVPSYGTAFQRRLGRVYVYYSARGIGLLSSRPQIFEGGKPNERLGEHVSTAGDVNGDGFAEIIIDSAVYYGARSGPASAPDWTAEDNGAPGAHSASTAGDVNGDGYDDLIVADGGDGAHVYHGSTSGLPSVPTWTQDPWYVTSVATAGDVNGDGYADVIVGADQYSTSEAFYVGRAYVYHGSASGLASAPAWFAEGNQEDARLGWVVGTAGDVNGDGYADVFAAAPTRYSVETGYGHVYAYHGSASGLSSEAAWTVEGWQEAARFGTAVSSAGDVNGDGYADLVVGAYRYSNGQRFEGAAFVYYGNNDTGPAPALAPQQLSRPGTVPVAQGGHSDRFGFALAAIGRTPFGRGPVKLEWEIKPLGVAFDGTGTEQSRYWVDTGTAGTLIEEWIGNPEPGPKHWRLRLLYDPSSTSLQSRSRWFTVPRNGWQERDLTVPSDLDSDEDGVPDYQDLCPFDYNETNADLDLDGIGDACDNCVGVYNPGQEETDGDDFGDECDRCPGVFNRRNTDSDDDGIADECDPFPFCPVECLLAIDPGGFPANGGTACSQCPFGRSRAGRSGANWPGRHTEWTASVLPQPSELEICPPELLELDLCCIAGPCPDASVIITSPDELGIHEIFASEVNPGPDSAFGTSAAFIDDLDGDGLPELAAGAPLTDQVSVIGSDSLGEIATLFGESEEMFGFGLDAHPLGIVVGAPGVLAESTGGRVLLIDPLSSEVVFETASSKPGDRFGWVVHTMPDVDGDGEKEILIGAPGDGQQMPGTVYRYQTQQEELLELTGPAAGERFGFSVASCDLDGDGSVEMIVGAPGAVDPVTLSVDGRVDILDENGELRQSLAAPWEGGQFGSSVSCGPDVDGDLRPDLLIGAPFVDVDGMPEAGRAVLYTSDGKLLAQWAGVAGDHLGRVVRLAGGQDGDSLADIVISDAFGGDGRGQSMVYLSDTD